MACGNDDGHDDDDDDGDDDGNEDGHGMHRICICMYISTHI